MATEPKQSSYTARTSTQSKPILGKTNLARTSFEAHALLPYIRPLPAIRLRGEYVSIRTERVDLENGIRASGIRDPILGHTSNGVGPKQLLSVLLPRGRANDLENPIHCSLESHWVSGLISTFNQPCVKARIVKVQGIRLRYEARGIMAVSDTITEDLPFIVRLSKRRQHSIQFPLEQDMRPHSFRTHVDQHLARAEVDAPVLGTLFGKLRGRHPSSKTRTCERATRHSES